MNGQRAERRSVSLYPQDWEVVEKVAVEERRTVSATIRRIIDEWQKLKAEAEKKRI